MTAADQGATVVSNLAPGVGFEPTADRLTVDCSTAELPRNTTTPKFTATQGTYNQSCVTHQAFFTNLPPSSCSVASSGLIANLAANN